MESDERRDREIVARARAWLAQDPDPGTRVQLSRLLEEQRLSELGSCMTKLEFGTAGLRAVEGPGPGRMNLAVVIRTTRGLAEYLRRREPEALALPVVVGWDARKNSQRYAAAAIGVLVAAGFNVKCFAEAVPTPIVAFAAREYGAQAAICLTASHNPREYAGFKVYAGNAVQIVAPADREIADAIDRVGPANLVPTGRSAFQQNTDGATAQLIDPSLVERYYTELMALRSRPIGSCALRIVYTPLHGVGGKHMLQVLSRAGYLDVHPVLAQTAPDPEFPTVPFPNPEEPGVLDLALKLAAKVNADLVLANDPDADRLAACVRLGAEGLRCLSGNQLGLLLADYVLRRPAAGATRLVVSSVVSSPMLVQIAEAHDAKCVQTLTGFKWMLNAALQLERERGLRFVFGYEEALGYCVAGPVLDKDGISAGLLFADMAAEARGLGRTILDELADLYARHGVWVSHLTNLAFEATPDALARAGASVRRLAAEPPQELSGLLVKRVRDYTCGESERPWYLGWADLVELELEGEARVLVRPSGTEPKLKIYADLKRAFQPRVAVAEQEHAAESRVEQLAEAMADFLRTL